MKGMKMANNFRPEKFYDREIINGKGHLVGKIRVKPSGISWRPKGSQNWYRVDLESFASFTIKNGTKQKK